MSLILTHLTQRQKGSPEGQGPIQEQDQETVTVLFQTEKKQNGQLLSRI